MPFFFGLDFTADWVCGSTVWEHYSHHGHSFCLTVRTPKYLLNGRKHYVQRSTWSRPNFFISPCLESNQTPLQKWFSFWECSPQQSWFFFWQKQTKIKLPKTILCTSFSMFITCPILDVCFIFENLTQRARNFKRWIKHDILKNRGWGKVAEKENRKVKKMRRDTNIRGSREDSKK